MALFGRKKEAKELKLPEAPMAFPDLPSEHEGKIHLMLKEVLQTGKTIEYIDARFEDMVVKIS